MGHIPTGNYAPTPAEVAYCAYLIWEAEGRPAGCEQEHWLQAETQLFACGAHDRWLGGLAYTPAYAARVS